MNLGSRESHSHDEGKDVKKKQNGAVARKGSSGNIAFWFELVMVVTVGARTDNGSIGSTAGCEEYAKPYGIDTGKACEDHAWLC